jgi:sugar phosphate isomerase/epimerase
MRLALSTTAFSRTLGAGELTQLELLDYCAGELRCDGIVLDIAHFPRRDSDYLAQVKKFAADVALSLVAVRDDELTSAQSDALILASHLGAPYVLTRMPDGGNDPVLRWNEALGTIGKSVSEAKRLNVTLAVRNIPGSLAADAFEMGRLRKEADSAWVCFALDAAELGSAPDPKVRKHVVLAYSARDADAADLDLLSPFNGFLCVDYAGTDNERLEVARRMRAWRGLLAEEELQAR